MRKRTEKTTTSIALAIGGLSGFVSTAVQNSVFVLLLIFLLKIRHGPNGLE
ncbi:MAG: hypothetical protein JSS93_06995 [Bacteroidetes bacterium]|nr:hypothetical protein [Bacteroidota bacterium]